MALIRIIDLHKDYMIGKRVIPAIRGIDLEIEKGEFLCIAGSSGSGKTTLLNLIGCMDKPTSGHVIIDGKDITELKEKELAKIRSRNISFIFQLFNLIPVLSIYENVELPLILRRERSNPEEILGILDKVGLLRYKDTKPENLSGGEQQRVAIARALVTDPKIILADEPTSNLDSENAIAIINLMQGLNELYKKTFIFSTHDDRLIKYASRVIKLQDGLIL